MRTSFIILFITSCYTLEAQDSASDTIASVTDKFWGIQTNGLELAYYQEHKLKPSLSFRGEAGLSTNSSSAHLR